MQCWCGPPGRPTRGYTTTTTTLERRDSRCPCDNSYEAEEARGARRRDVHAAASSGARTRTERGPLRPRPSCLCLRWKWNPSYPSSVPNGRAALLCCQGQPRTDGRAPHFPRPSPVALAAPWVLVVVGAVFRLQSPEDRRSLAPGSPSPSLALFVRVPLAAPACTSAVPRRRTGPLLACRRQSVHLPAPCIASRSRHVSLVWTELSCARNLDI
jgi:hypothetical protein